MTTHSLLELEKNLKKVELQKIRDSAFASGSKLREALTPVAEQFVKEQLDTYKILADADSLGYRQWKHGREVM